MRPLQLAAAVAVVAPLTASAAEGGGGGSALITPHIGTILWTIVTFLCLMFLLGKFAWKPLLSSLDERESSIRADIDQAKNDRAEAERILAEQQKLLDQSRRERAEAVAAGQRDAEVLKAEILAEAQKQKEQMIGQARMQIDAATRQAREELRGVVAGLAIQAAEKLLSKNLDEASQRKLVEDYLADLEAKESTSFPS